MTAKGLVVGKEFANACIHPLDRLAVYQVIRHCTELIGKLAPSIEQLVEGHRSDTAEFFHGFFGRTMGTYQIVERRSLLLQKTQHIGFFVRIVEADRDHGQSFVFQFAAQLNHVREVRRAGISPRRPIIDQNDFTLMPGQQFPEFVPAAHSDLDVAGRRGDARCGILTAT